MSFFIYKFFASFSKKKLGKKNQGHYTCVTKVCPSQLPINTLMNFTLSNKFTSQKKIRDSGSSQMINKATTPIRFFHQLLKDRIKKLI
jgi:hypothetical protein